MRTREAGRRGRRPVQGEGREEPVGGADGPATCLLPSIRPSSHLGRGGSRDTQTFLSLVTQTPRSFSAPPQPNRPGQAEGPGPKAPAALEQGAEPWSVFGALAAPVLTVPHLRGRAWFSGSDDVSCDSTGSASSSATVEQV